MHSNELTKYSPILCLHCLKCRDWFPAIHRMKNNLVAANLSPYNHMGFSTPLFLTSYIKHALVKFVIKWRQMSLRWKVGSETRMRILQLQKINFHNEDWINRSYMAVYDLKLVRNDICLFENNWWLGTMISRELNEGLSGKGVTSVRYSICATTYTQTPGILSFDLFQTNFK